MYADSFKTHGDSPGAVLWPKGRQKERFDALTANIGGAKNFSVLDFGCGLAHLKDYLSEKFRSFEYTGVDIVEEFIEANKKKYPNATFMSVDEFITSLVKYDYSVASGTFNIVYEKDVEANKKYVMNTLKSIFERTNVAFAFNFMTDEVDFIQEGAFHINPSELYNYCKRNLSKRVLLNQSYMPYEFTITVWKDDGIVRPDNIYKVYE